MTLVSQKCFFGNDFFFGKIMFPQEILRKTQNQRKLKNTNGYWNLVRRSNTIKFSFRYPVSTFNLEQSYLDFWNKWKLKTQFYYSKRILTMNFALNCTVEQWILFEGRDEDQIKI